MMSQVLQSLYIDEITDIKPDSCEAITERINWAVVSEKDLEKVYQIYDELFFALVDIERSQLT